ncbi:DUF423 domain-containing protein [Roseiarcaceae bacterium H3SJ34-1]|uniref:DUF423 domain-containing protein n=1 Tax=Terripilifer ovatus TaxID=3032367 RepID=UPI003AB9A8F2|nr:DUF423 domain-containing protein [Roseiarcaceae bacterium H3SJ34-1]
MHQLSRIFMTAAGLMGAAGVALAAAGAHAAGADLLNPASNMLLFHAAAVLALAMGGAPRMLMVSGGLLVLGAALFSGDLALRALAGVKLFAMAAPSGGILLIGGWLSIAAIGAFGRSIGNSRQS